MASSQPTSSPTRSISPDRFDLSPQSRLRKLLATVESDSESEEKLKKVINQPRFTRSSSPISDKGSRAKAPLDSQNDSDDDDVVRSRGRIASKIESESKNDEDDARARVRKLLERSTTRDQAQPISAGDSSEDDEFESRPRGRLASRMQGAAGPVKERASQTGSEQPTNESAITNTKETGDVEMADAEDDDYIPVRRRNPTTRQVRSNTPGSASNTPQKEASPGLFVTPSKSPPSAQESPAADSGDESDLPTINSDRFKELVLKKRKERLSREAEEARKKEARAAALEELGDDKDDDVSDISDDDGGRKLTQTQEQSRPSRKASKKAMEEMNRETQRMQRAMQLAHEAKTKKKITKAALFERFNYKPAGNSVTNGRQQSSSRPQTPSSMKSTDAEMQDADTPPSSPPARVQDVLGKDLQGSASYSGGATSGGAAATTELLPEDNKEGLPDILDIKAFARKPLNKGKETATTPVKNTVKRHVRVKLPPIQVNSISLSSDDEDDLVVVDKKKGKLDALFDRVPKNQSKESSSLRMLRHLAHLDSPERKAHKKTDKSAMTPGELQAFLQQQARQQAKLERERRLEALKAKGIHIQTEEERERDREQIEDMVARARREAEEIMDRERDEAKMEKKARGEDPLAWDDSASDDDYVEDKDGEDDPDTDVELSGSEDENNEEEPTALEDDDDEEEEDEQTPKKTSAAQGLIDETAADAADGSETEESWVDPDEEEERHRWGKEDESVDATPAFVQAMRPQGSFTLDSDHEDLEVEATPKPFKTYAATFTPKPTATRGLDFTPGPNKNTSPEVPTSVLRSAAKTFIPGLPVDAGGPAGLGLTQIFAGTMDDSQGGPLDGSPSQPMPTLDNFADSQSSQNMSESADAMVLDSQTVPATQADREDESQIRLDFSQSQTHGLDSLLRDDLATQSSELFNLSQDNGFQKWTPLKERFVEPPMSTVDTVIRDPSDAEDMSHDSPLQKRSRIRRKALVASDSEDEGSDSGSKPSAFRKLQEAAAQEKKRKAREEFNKKKSKAKQMVEEQAEESEDEYAGLGGVDGEDSDDDDAASVHEMIDDQTQGGEEDETNIAALHAERQRAEDAKQTDKLFHDITRGMLRRKRGADYDLSDSDDGGEARRRMKRRQFAKMQKMLLSDERVSKVAENPRNQAFLRTIEDVGSDEEMDFLFEPAPRNNENSQLSNYTGGATAASQDNDAHKTVPDSQPLAAAGAVNKQPIASRRSKNGRKPKDIGEIRETLSSLLEEPSGNTVISATDFDSDSGSEDGNDSESSNKENANPRRGGAVVDRISLKRQGSSNVSNASTGGRMAFAAPSASANGGFKVPALLRKATTNSFMSSGSSNGSGNNNNNNNGGSAGGFGEEAKIKKNVGKRSGISYLARETDRRAKLDEAEKRREAKKFKAVEGRSRVVGGLFGAGKFE